MPELFEKDLTSMHINRLCLLVPMILGLAIAYSGTQARAEFIVNGGFEEPTTGGVTMIPAGSSLLTGWTIVSGSVDVVASSFTPFEGSQSLDMDGSSAGTIEQAFATVIGASYNLVFAYADNPWGGTDPASANVSLSGLGTSDLLSQDITHGESTIANMNWNLFSFNFTANSSTTNLRFSSLNPSGSTGGIFLDAVSVTVVPEPSSLALVCIGGSVGLAGLWRRRSRKTSALGQARTQERGI